MRKVLWQKLTPHTNPGYWFELDGSRIKIIKAKIITEGEPGVVLDEKFTIGCSKIPQILRLKKGNKK